MAPKVRVNTVTPGGVARGQLPEFVERYEAKTPLKRMATEQDVSYAIAMLMDPGAGYITGQNLLVDGGWTAW
jgi:NAD(P)-dependent dehydrogenase (short-subunit alcohol dehydrogenase family)